MPSPWLTFSHRLVVWVGSWHTLGRRPRTFVAFLLLSSCKLQHFVKRRRAYGPFFTRFRPAIYSLFFRFSAFSATFLSFFRLALPRIPHWGGVGWGGMIKFICTSHRHDATLWSVVLHLFIYMKLRDCTSSCTSSQAWCYATAAYFSFLLLGVGWGGMITFICTSHRHDATLWSVVLHLFIYMKLRDCTSSCTSSQAWCYATAAYFSFLLLGMGWGGVGWGGMITFICTSHRHDATLWSVVLHFFTGMMLRYGRVLFFFASWGGVGWGGMITFICTSHRHDATLWSVVLHLEELPLPITPIAFLEELKRLLKQWGKKALNCYFAVVWVKAKLRNVKKHWVFS